METFSIKEMRMTCFSEKAVYGGDKKVKMAIEMGIERRLAQLSPKAYMGQCLGLICEGLVKEGLLFGLVELRSFMRLEVDAQSFGSSHGPN